MNDNHTAIPQPKHSLTPKGVYDIPQQSEGFVFNHTMLRVKDPVKSLAFYSKILGMSLVLTKQFPEMSFDLYFLAKLNKKERDNFPDNATDRSVFAFKQRGILELVHNYGTENQPDFSYHNGNQTPQGFGHICFSVPDFNSAIDWFDENHVEYAKRPEDGTMKNIAFIKDPDGYWIEIVQAENIA